MRYAPAIRIYLGLVWLVNGGLKLGDPLFTQPGGQCQRWLVQFTAGTTGPYHQFVHQIVIPHVTFFATLVEWSETLAGLALIAGLLTRFAAGGSIFLAANYWVMRGAYMTVGGYVDIEPDLIALATVVLLWPATREFALSLVTLSLSKGDIESRHRRHLT
jgi:uncharacterized membrane protein YphA (DoxX/SURF4 family)